MTNETSIDTPTHRRAVVRHIRRDIETGKLSEKYDADTFAEIALHCLNMGHSLAWAVSDAFSQSRLPEPSKTGPVVDWNNCSNEDQPATYLGLYFTGCSRDIGCGVDVDVNEPDFYAIYGMNQCGEIEPLHDFPRGMTRSHCWSLTKAAAKQLGLTTHGPECPADA